MEENSQRKPSLYKENAIVIGTFLGGPLVAGYFFAENFKVLDEEEKIRLTWVIAIATLFCVILIAVLLPEDINIPNQIIPITYTALAYGLYKTHQEEKVKQLFENGNPLYSWWRVIGISIIGLLVTIGLLLSVLFIFGGATF